MQFGLLETDYNSKHSFLTVSMKLITVKIINSNNFVADANNNIYD